MGFKNEDGDDDRQSGFGQREMHDITCSSCGAQAQVPFKPVEGRPVYCRDCYRKNRPSRQ